MYLRNRDETISITGLIVGINITVNKYRLSKLLFEKS